jgi:hypothetical protein
MKAQSKLFVVCNEKNGIILLNKPVKFLKSSLDNYDSPLADKLNYLIMPVVIFYATAEKKTKIKGKTFELACLDRVRFWAETVLVNYHNFASRKVRVRTRKVSFFLGHKGRIDKFILFFWIKNLIPKVENQSILFARFTAKVERLRAHDRSET